MLQELSKLTTSPVLLEKATTLVNKCENSL